MAIPPTPPTPEASPPGGDECKPLYATFSNLFIDDIVLVDGRVSLNMLGGAGAYSLAGMALWSSRLGCVASVGDDFEAGHRSRLSQLGVDLTGLLVRPNESTPRAWQHFGPNDQRTQVLRTDLKEYRRNLPRYEDMPCAYHDVLAIHVLLETTLADTATWMTKLHRDSPRVEVVWEPGPDQLEGGEQAFGPALRQCAVFSPDLEQARRISGLSEPDDIASLFVEWGAPTVAVRMGANGSFVASRSGERWIVPAISPRQLVDVTGAGNAYCGGFAVGLGEGRGTKEASLLAAVSASFAIEQFGVPTVDRSAKLEARRRLCCATVTVPRP